MRTADADPVPVVDAEPEGPSVWWLFALALFGAVILSGAISAQTYLSMLGHGHSFTGILAWQLSCWSVWALVAPAVVREAGRLVGERQHARRTWVRLAAMGAACVTIHVALAAQLAIWFQPFVPVREDEFRQAVTGQLFVVPVDVLVYSVLVLIGWAVAGARMARRLEIRESRLETELAKAQLQALRLEIQPHFLFNTLNSIAALIRLKSNDRALDMLVGLSDLMRSTLDRTGEQLCTLDAELEFTRRYVDLQLARFANRLDVRYLVDPECGECPVPTFLLQPLVENAIRHGLARQNRRGSIEVGARMDSDQLHLWVADDGVGLAPGFDITRDARTGLGNTRSRLERLYGPSASLAVDPGPHGGTVARIIVDRSAMTRAEAIA